MMDFSKHYPGITRMTVKQIGEYKNYEYIYFKKVNLAEQSEVLFHTKIMREEN